MKISDFQILLVAAALAAITFLFNKRISEAEQLLYNAYLELEAERLKLNIHLMQEHGIVSKHLDNTGALTKYYGND